MDQSKMIVMPISGWDLGMAQEMLGKAAIGNPIGQWECKRKFMWPLYCKLLVWPKDHMHGPYLWYSGIYLVFYNHCLIVASPQWVHTVCRIIYMSCEIEIILHLATPIHAAVLKGIIMIIMHNYGIILLEQYSEHHKNAESNVHGHPHHLHTIWHWYLSQQRSAPV